MGLKWGLSYFHLRPSSWFLYTSVSSLSLPASFLASSTFSSYKSHLGRFIWRDESANCVLLLMETGKLRVGVPASYPQPSWWCEKIPATMKHVWSQSSPLLPCGLPGPNSGHQLRQQIPFRLSHRASSIHGAFKGSRTITKINSILVHKASLDLHLQLYITCDQDFQ